MHRFLNFLFPTPSHAARLLLVGSLWASVGTALAAPFEDNMAQRTLACTACHGPQGRAAPDGYYPRLAGKPAAYLYHQLLHFRDGRRHYGLMTQLLEPLSDAYLMEMAQYFSSLDVPYPAPLPTAASPELLRRGERLVMYGDSNKKLPACVQCHGPTMTGVAPDVPGLLGLPRDYLNAQLGAWKSGQRRAHAPDCMRGVVARLDDGDINAAASWLAAQPVPVNSKPAGQPSELAAGAVAIVCGSAATATAGKSRQ